MGPASQGQNLIQLLTLYFVKEYYGVALSKLRILMLPIFVIYE